MFVAFVRAEVETMFRVSQMLAGKSRHVLGAGGLWSAGGRAASVAGCERFSTGSSMQKKEKESPPSITIEVSEGDEELVEEEEEVVTDSMQPWADRERVRQEHCWTGGREARRGRRTPQPMAEDAAVGGYAARDYPEEHSHDWADWLREDGDRPAAGPAGGRALYQGGGDQVHRGGLPRARRRHDHPGPS